MNTLSFTAKFAYASNDDDCYVVGFADDEFDYDHYVMLQKAFEFDEQDIALGMDGEYVEIDGQENSGYKRVESLLFDRERICINVKSEGNQTDRVEIDLGEIQIDESKYAEILLEILPDKVHFI